MTLGTKLRGTCSKCTNMLFALFIVIPTNSQKQDGLIYVLQWSYNIKDSWEKYWHLEKGQQAFVSRNCSFQNCFLTHDRLSLNSILEFDVLLFNLEYTSEYKGYGVPQMRSENQLYVFLSSESAALYPIVRVYNNFFNLTWTYKFSSDIFHPFFVVKNIKGEIIAPKQDVHWLNFDDLPATNNSIVQKFVNKSIAAAWVAGSRHCGDRFEPFDRPFEIDRYVFVKNLNRALSKYGHRVHMYGECGNLSCSRVPREREHLLFGCYNKIESDYYFYLAFENSFDEDYVTEKVLHGLLHYSVPIVFGGADYTRFLPTGSYIDALKLGEENLAKEMYDIINNPQRYYDFFKWHGIYSFQDTTDRDHRESICEFCAFLNSEKQNSKGFPRIYNDITGWWNGNRPSEIPVPAPVNPVPEPDSSQSIVSQLLDFFLGE